MNIRKYLPGFKYFIRIVLVLLPSGVMAHEYFVAPASDDSNAGSIDAPFASLAKALSIVLPGDTIFMREGRYLETITTSGVSGSAGNPVTILSYAGEEVIFDGTEDIMDISNGVWELHEGNIYKIKLSKDIWQLFAGINSIQPDSILMMISARWPNVKNMWDGSHWYRHRNQAYIETEGSDTGYIKDLPHHDINLASTGKSFEGAMAMLNTGSFQSFERVVTSHMAGSGSFNFVPVPGREDRNFKSDIKSNRGRYFLDCHINCLDIENEWYFDRESGILYLYAPGGVDPGSLKVRGKTRNYFLDVDEWNHVRVQDIQSFGCAFNLSHCTNFTFEDCRFLYPSYNERMMGIGDPREKGANPVCNAKNDREDTTTNNKILNCVFAHTDSDVLHWGSGGSVLENILFEDVDWAGIGTNGLSTRWRHNVLYRRITLREMGSPHTIQNDAVYNNMELLRISNYGWMNYDGSSAESSGKMTSYSWIHDSPKLAYRVDNTKKDGSTYHHNVVFNSYHNKDKGDYHAYYNLTHLNSVGEDLYMVHMVGSDVNNEHSLFRNIASGQIGADPLPGSMDHSWEGDINDELRDPLNLDFRLKNGSTLIDAGVTVPGITEQFNGSAPDLGAYEYGDEFYWIPGYQTAAASTPVPPDDAIQVKPDVDLMWLGGYKGTSHKVYFGSSPDAPAPVGTFTNNICDPGDLQEGKQYFWRVDCQGENGTVKGDTWSFITEGGKINRYEFRVAADAYVSLASKTTTGSRVILYTRKFDEWHFGSGSQYILLKFNVEGLSGTVSNVKLQFVPNEANELGLHSTLPESWDEGSVTWFNRPITYVSHCDLLNHTVANAWNQLDARSIVRSEGSYTLALTSAQTTSKEFGIYSKEYQRGEYAPRLIVETIENLEPDTTTQVTDKVSILPKVNIYPNPLSGDELYMSPEGFLPGESLKVVIINNFGQQIHHQEIVMEGSRDYIINLAANGLGTGVYLISVNNGFTSTFNKLIVL